jgi:hypothetical protein
VKFCLYDIRWSSLQSTDIASVLSSGLTKSIGKPDEDFSLTIAKRGEEGVPVAEFFDVEEPELESWNFTWYV